MYDRAEGRPDPTSTALQVTMTVDETAAPADQNGETQGQQGPTAAQLRRFIKSRPYVPLHELRRRFELNGDSDQVSQVEVGDKGPIYVGLPTREAEFVATLARDGDIGLELCHDPRVPVVVGVYPMRPVTRT
jgi:hypothetical protein